MKGLKEEEQGGQEAPHLWQRIRGWLLFALACITSPCCTPLIVPLILTILAGTPVAIWLSAYIGWVYGALTAVSVISLVVGLRWLGQKHDVQRPNEQRRHPIQLSVPDLENS